MPDTRWGTLGMRLRGTKDILLLGLCCFLAAPRPGQTACAVSHLSSPAVWNNRAQLLYRQA